MLRSGNKTIAITMGDPCGIGPEVLAAAFCQLRMVKHVEIIVIGNEEVFSRYWPKGKPAPSLVHVADRPRVFHKPGKPTPASALDSFRYLEHAVMLVRSGAVHGMVTGPLSKEAVIPFSTGFKGHTTFLAQAFGLKNVEMLFVAQDLRVVLVTRHVPVRDVPGLLTSAKVFDVIETTALSLHEHFGIKRPRIAVCGLNPHAGEGGHMGREEITRITPAILKLRRDGWDVAGPFPADTLFEPKVRAGYDLIAAMYHDQALAPLKAQYFNKLVNVTLGLPFIRTSPAHGTAFGIAGQGIADPGSMQAALKLAMELV